MSLQERHDGEDEGKSQLHLDSPPVRWNAETLLLAVDVSAIMLKSRMASHKHLVFIASITALLTLGHYRQLHQVRRVGYNHYGAHTLLFHLKTLLGMGTLLLLDILITLFLLNTLTAEPVQSVKGDLIATAADGVALTSSIWYIIAEYALSCYQHWSDEEDFKSVTKYRQAAVIVGQTLKLFSYAVFLSLHCHITSHPFRCSTFSVQTSIHILHLLWLCLDVYRQRHSVQKLVAKLPNASKPSKVDAESDATICLICRDDLFHLASPHNSSVEMLQAAKRLSCGHHFHGDCLSSWLHRSFQCPTCRRAPGPS